MAKKNAIVDTFNADEATVDTLLTAELVKKGKYRVFNGTNYDIVYLQTSADQVIESESKNFVSLDEKNTWNRKADTNHHHDDVYAKKGESHTKSEITNLLSSKSEVGHTHDASTIKQEPGYNFVSDSEKLKWNNTSTMVEQINTRVTEINNSVETLETENATAHSDIINKYDTAVSDVNSKIAAVKAEVTSLTSNKAEKNDVETQIEQAKESLQAIINTKANKLDVDNSLKLKADTANVYDRNTIDNKLSSKVEASTLSSELKKKVDTTKFESDLQLKANASEVTTALQEKASTQALETGLSKKADKSHEHNALEITGLGTAAALNVGKEHGNIPVLNEKGQLETSVLPAIAINQKFPANNPTEAMKIPMEIGDILVLTNTAREDAIEKQKKGEAITYQVAKSKIYQELSDEYTTYIRSGKITYLCVDDKATTFEEKFKPLQSSGDTITSAEVQTKLNLKVDLSEFNSYKNHVSSKFDLKADISNTYTKDEVNNYLDGKVNVENGKKLSSNDFTNELKDKLERLNVEANNYVHPDDDGDLHVPATGSNSNGKVLMAGASPKIFSWTTLTTGHVSESGNRRYVTNEQIEAWNAKANSDHKHDEYRLISQSFTKDETRSEISKMRTIISNTQPPANSHMVGAVWIEEITN